MTLFPFPLRDLLTAARSPLNAHSSQATVERPWTCAPEAESAVQRTAVFISQPAVAVPDVITDSLSKQKTYEI